MRTILRIIKFMYERMASRYMARRQTDEEIEKQKEQHKLRTGAARSARRSGKITKKEGKVEKSRGKTKTPRSQKKIATIKKSRY